MSTQTSNPRLQTLQSQIWTSTLPLSIILSPSDCETYTDCPPYLINFPRLSYLAFLLPRLHAFFRPKLIDRGIPAHEAWIEFEGVPLKWHYPVGLLCDLYAGWEAVDGRERDHNAEGGGEVGRDEGPVWRLTVHYTDFPSEHLIQLDAGGKMLRDWFVNAVKEADYVRNGSGRPVMGLSKQDSDRLWESVRGHEMVKFNSVNAKLLHAPGVEMRHVPLKIYLPTVSVDSTTQTIQEEGNGGEGGGGSAGHFRVVQALAPLAVPGTKTLQTLGTALHAVLPAVFPSRRNPLLAQPVLHGAVVPMGARLEDLGRAVAYTDGFLHVVVSMFG